MEGYKTVGSHPLVSRFIHAVYQTRPCLPRYQCTWDTSVMLNYLKTLSPVKDLKLKDLTLKLVMLIALVTGQRGQSIHLMDLQSMTKTAVKYKFVIRDFVKQSAPGRIQPELILPLFKEDNRICVYTV